MFFSLLGKKFGFPKYPTSSIEDLFRLFHNEKNICLWVRKSAYKKNPLFYNFCDDVDYDM